MDLKIPKFQKLTPPASGRAHHGQGGPDGVSPAFIPHYNPFQTNNSIHCRSFVLAETFKYLYMVFSEPSQLPFDPDDYVLTTEAHFLPLSIGDRTSTGGSETSDRILPRKILLDPHETVQDVERHSQYQSACPYQPSPTRTSYELADYGSGIRENVGKVLDNMHTVTSALNAIGDGQQGSCSSAYALFGW